MRSQVWMVAALVIDLLGPPPDVVGQAQMKLQIAKGQGQAIELSSADEKRTLKVPDQGSADAPARIEKFKAAQMTIQSLAVKSPDQPAALNSKMPAKSSDQPATEISERPVVYRAGRLPAELPAWFARLDADNDGQVGLYEWRESDWPIADFQRLDRNGDGFLTAEEVLSALARVQARGIVDEALVRQLPSDFHPTTNNPLRLVKLGEAKLVDGMPLEVKPKKADQADGPVPGLKPAKMIPLDGPPIKEKGLKPGKPAKDGL